MVLSLVICVCFGLLNSFADGDPCTSRPCQNGGVCTSFDGSSFVCKCPKRYFGNRCEKLNDACKVNPCQHGECREDAFGDYHCYCSPGFHGKFCELNHDDCLSSPCQNSALCIDKVDDYECVCKEGTFGKRCELRHDDIETCAKECPQGSICWRNYTTTMNIPWGYGDNICNTQHSCFGGQNSTDKDHYDYFIDVQLHPVQMQLGDFLNFTSDDTISAAINGLMPRLLPVDIHDDSKSFVNCNTTNGTQLVTSEQHSIIINSSDLLHTGLHYFVMNIDFTFRCDFGLRLNVSVKNQSCQDPQFPHSGLCSDRGQCHTNFNLGEYQCKCCPGFRGKYCEKRDYCFASPCKNQAVCVNGDEEKNEESYRCHCQPGYEGKHCSIVENTCLSHPCRNGAICHPRVNSYYCECSTGYTGRNCETDIDECFVQPCKNNGTCFDDIAGFSCVCPKGFTGSNCEVNINECESNPCQHGVCIDKINGFQCLCHPGYTGAECDTTMNKCASNPCMHGGVCIDKGKNYSCDCGIGYFGRNCENDIDLCNKPEICNNFQSCIDQGSRVNCICKPGFTGSNCGVDVDDCASQPCQFGGKCHDQEGGFYCLCSPGYEGKICDQVNETFHDPARLHIKFITEDCYRLQDPTIIQDFGEKIAASIHLSCKCPFTENNIINRSISLKCHDKISGSLYLHITEVKPYQTEQLICIHQLALTRTKNIASLGNKTSEVGVVYNNERCAEVNRQLEDTDNETKDGGTVALTVGLVFALVGLFAAAFIVFLKWRKKRGPAKKSKSDDKQLADSMNLDLLSAIAPTPKSLYRTNAAAHRNYGFTSHNFDAIDPRSKRI